MMRRFNIAPPVGADVSALVGSICIGCGCTDDDACEGGCAWLVRSGGVGVCSSCRHALPAWEQGARLAGWMPEPWTPLMRISLEGTQLQPYKPGTGQPPGTYFVVDNERGTFRLVDLQGEPATSVDGQLQIDFDWAQSSKLKTAEAKRRGWLPREPSADQKRGQQLKAERSRAKAKAAKKARQAQRRRL